MFVDSYFAKNELLETSVEKDINYMTAFKIGCFQVLALFPGVSRSASTIVGGLVQKLNRKTAAEFSFFLSMPTMAGAFAYDLYKNRDVLDASALGDIAVGFVMAFISAVLVVRWLLGYLGNHGFAVFGWWRIAVGATALVALLAGHGSNR